VTHPPDVICLGILVTDVLARPVERFPERGKLVLVDRMEMHIGGCAANTGIGLSKLGVPTGVMGKVGRDGFGDFVLETLQQHKVDTRGVGRDRTAATSGTMVLIHDDGERSFIHQIGANATLQETELELDLLQGAKLLHVAGAFLMPGFDGAPMASVLRRAKSQGLTTALDTAWDSSGQWMDLIGEALPHVDYFLPSYEEARELAGCDEPREIAQRFLGLGVQVVALKLGEQGCLVTTADAEVRVPIFPVKAIDATGAGDSFVAGFLAGVLRGWQVERCARLGNAVGACCVQAIGTTTGIRSFEETVEQFNV